MQIQVFSGEGFVRYSVESDRLYEVFVYSNGAKNRYGVDCAPVAILPDNASVRAIMSELRSDRVPVLVDVYPIDGSDEHDSAVKSGR
jgi:hypothetical protein